VASSHRLLQHRRPPLATLIVLLGIASLLGACTTESDQQSKASGTAGRKPPPLNPQAETQTVPEAQGPEDLFSPAEVGRPGGRLVVDLRAEPSTFNPVMSKDTPTRTVLRRTIADLIHVDRSTQETVAALASSSTVAEDGRRFELELRRGVQFSDGHPFDADDVLFSFEVYLDQDIASTNRDALIVGGEPIIIRKLDSHRIEVTLSEPYPVGDRLFDSIAMLPRHRLEKAYRAGEFTSAWGLGTPPSELVGLGPFRLRRYVPGERVELERNPYYWKTDRDGQRLPYLDEIIFRFAPNEDVQTIRFKSGATHMIHRLSAKSYALLERDQEKHGYRLYDLGPELRYEFLFFNLNDLTARDLPEITRKQGWFQQTAFRRAVSLAIDRQSIAHLTFQDRATPLANLVPPSNRRWRNQDLPGPVFDPDQARHLLRQAGFRWDQAGTLHDSLGQPVTFTLITNSSNRTRLEMAAIVQDDLKALGMDVHVVALEHRTVVSRVIKTADYEACMLGLYSDFDPNGQMNFLMSSGGSHLWKPNQESP
jgi:peptide/nickel transport system substrate-binding protein